MKLYIETPAWHKIQHYVDSCTGEVSGLGKVEYKDGDFYVTDVKIFKQEVSGAHSDIDSETLAQFQVELIRAGESTQDWTLWWHSHANMGAFFSGTDTNTIDNSTDYSYMVSLVTNHNHDTVARVDTYQPFRMSQTLETVILLPEIPEEIQKECDSEIEKKVTKKVSVQVPNQSVGFRTGGRLFDTDYDYDYNYGSYGHTPSTVDEWWIEDMGDYYELKEELTQELKSAQKRKDRSAVQVAQYELDQLLEQGKRKGYEQPE